MSSYKEPLLRLFHGCNDLRRSFLGIEEQAQRIQEISMNASVVSAQTGKNSRACGEIARQIAKTSGRIRLHTNDMRDEVNAVVNLTSAALILDGRFLLFLKAWKGIGDAHNSRLVLDQLWSINAEITGKMFEINKRVFPVESRLKSLASCQYRLYGTINALRVESTEIFGPQFATIHTLANYLAETVEDGLAKLECAKILLRTIRANTRTVERMVEYSLLDKKETQDAISNAA